MRLNWYNISIYLSGIVLMFVLWWLFTMDSSSSLHRFNPKGTFVAFGELLNNPRYWESVLETMKRLIGGLAIATVIGIPLGLITGYFLRLHQLTYVPFQFIRMISPLSWTPVAIIVFGIGSGPVYFLISIAAVWPVLLNTAAGVHAADKLWVQVARSLGANDRGILKHILLRASLPHVLTGIQLALGVSWIVLVPAEMLGVSSGLGYMILDYRDINGYDSIMAIILTIGMLGLLTDLPLRRLVKHFRWN
ncbi:MAG: ABC transporter permease [Bacteroidota bacterium]